MKITFVTPTPLDLSAFGVRALSAFLKQKGIEVRNIFLPGGIEKYRYRNEYLYQYDKNILDELVDLCKGSDLIGISTMSNYFERAIQLTSVIKKATQLPVIWGGIHPTVMPEDSLKYCDMLCIGEGEYALYELIQRIGEGQDYTNVKNIWVKKNGNVIRNPLRSLEQNLDCFPFYDFGMDDVYVYDIGKKAISPMTPKLLELSFLIEPYMEGTFYDSYKKTRSYKTMTTRGCPHRCTFCAEKTMAELYEGQQYLRKRSISHIIGELERVKDNFPFVESIFLFDDTFLIRKTDEIIELSKVYKEKIGLPFHIQASPLTLTEKKIEALIDAGLVFVEMGIQTTSEVGKTIYHRHVSDEKLLTAANILAKYRDKIYAPCYHIILDNPWEKTEDVLETLKFVLALPQPFWLKRSSLVCFPGTYLFTKAKEEGIIKTEEDISREIYRKHLHQPKGSYANFLLYLAGFCYFPRWIIKLLAQNFFVRIFDRPLLKPLFFNLNKLGNGLIILSKGIKSLFKGDFNRINRYLVRRFSQTV